MDSWPSELQQTLNADSNFTYILGDTTVRSTTDVGPAKVRSRFTDAVDTLTATILLTADQFSTLNDFYRTVLGSGVLPFLMTHPMTGNDAPFRFTSPPSFQPLGGLVFTVTLNLEILP